MTYINEHFDMPSTVQSGFNETGWSIGKAAGCTVDPNVSASGVTGYAENWQLYCLQCTTDNAAEQAMIYRTISGGQHYLSMDFIVAAETLLDNERFYLFRIYLAGENISYIVVRKEVGVLYLRNYCYHDNAYHSYRSIGAISLNTKYRVELYWNSTGNAWGWRIDGVNQPNNIDATDPVTSEGTLSGAFQTTSQLLEIGLMLADKPSTIYIDNVRYSDTAPTGNYFGDRSVVSVIYADSNAVHSHPDGSSWTKAYLTIQGALTQMVPGNTIKIDATSVWTLATGLDIAIPLTFESTTDVGHSGSFELDGVGIADDIIEVHPTGVGSIIQNVELANAPNAKSAIKDSGGAIIHDVTFTNNYQDLTVNGVHTILRYSTLDNPTNCPLTVIVNGSNLEAYYNKIIGGTLNWFDGTAIGSIYNNVIVNMHDQALINTGSGEVLFKNNILLNCCNVSADYIVKNTGAGSVVASNNILLRNIYESTTKFLDATVTDGGGNIYVSPRFVNPYRTGIVSIVVDDYNLTTETFAPALNDLASTFGYNITWAVNNFDYAATLSGLDSGILQSFVSNGGDIATHSYHHVNLSERETLQIQNTNGACALTIDIGAGLLTTVGDSAFSMDLTDTVTYDQNSNGFVDMQDIAVFINAMANYTCVVKDTTSNNVEYTSLADVVGQDINSGVYTCLLDPTRFYSNEIQNSIDELEAMVPGLTITALVYPANKFDDTGINTIKTMVDGARAGGVSTEKSMVTGMNIYKMHGANPQTLIGTTNITRNTASLCEHLNDIGGASVLYCHTPAEYSLTNWATIFQAFRNSNITVMTLSEQIAWIRDNGTTGDDLTYTVAITANDDFKIIPGSPAMNAGTDVSLVRDYYSNPIVGNPDIGIYELMLGGNLSPGLGLSGGHRPPWWNRRR